jgi:hypothetical protein
MVMRAGSDAVRSVEVPARECSRCGAVVTQWVEMTRRGEPAVLGVTCLCYATWLQHREIWEFEVTGVVKP